jgi:hypothetical protein
MTRRRQGLAVAALLALYWLMAVSASPRVGVAVDEIAHLASGYSYWQSNDFRMHPENGTLTMRAAALPLLAMDLQFPPEDRPDWRRADIATIGRDFFFELGNPLDRMLLAGRAMIALFGVLTLWLVWRWASGLGGPAAGLSAVALGALSPTLLAHGGLVTSDIALTACLLAVVTAFWRLLHAITWPRLSLATLAGGAVLLAKMSGVLAAPILAVLILVRWLRAAPLPVRLGGRSRWLRKRSQVVAATLGVSVFVASGSLVLLWGGYGFRYSGFNAASTAADGYYFTWEQILGEEPLPPNDGESGVPSRVLASADPTGPSGMTRTIAWMRDHRLLPEAYLWGFAHTYKFSRARPAFLNGEYRTAGWPGFFPLAFLMKTTLPVMLLFAAGVALVAAQKVGRRRRCRLFHRLAPLLVLFAIYWAMAVTTKLNIGHRHILPIYPVVFMGAGFAAAWLLSAHVRRWGRFALAVAVLGQAVDSFAARPFYLSYFNILAGGTDGGWRHLVDSSFDWGQGLPDLQRWLREKEARADGSPVYLTYFGTDSPRARGIDVRRFADDLNDYGPRNYPTIPTGGWFVIGATHFQRVYLHLTGPWNAERETLYRSLAARLFDPDLRAGGTTPEAGPELLRDAQDFELLLFGRLCQFLSGREPDTVIGGSLLAFRLTDEEIAFAFGAPFEAIVPAAAQ